MWQKTPDNMIILGDTSDGFQQKIMEIILTGRNNTVGKWKAVVIMSVHFREGFRKIM